MKKEPKRPTVIFCAICGKEIQGNYEANKTRRGTVIYLFFLLVIWFSDFINSFFVAVPQKCGSAC